MSDTTHFLQTPVWGEFKSKQGWEQLFFDLSPGVPVLALVRRFRFFALCYIPMLPTDEGEVIATIADALRDRLPKNTLCIRVDPEPAYLSVEECDERLGQLLGAHLRKAAADVQPPDTVFLDLSPDTENLLAAMKSKWRYNIRLATKSGVTVRRGTVADMGAFYRIYRTTAERDKIAIHGQGYYEALLGMKPSGADAGDVPEIRLY
jgi:lipid II:glycine glycyltransferase (peptidoglycan interpeptide bridge formation enzyme)